MISTHRFFHAHSHVLYPLKREESGIPSIYRQAEQLGGEFTRILRGLPKNNVANFSPSVIKHHGKTYIAWRSQPEPFGFRYDMKYFYLNDQPTDIYIGELADDKTIVGAKKLRSKKHRLSYEDPRLFVGPDDNLYVQFVSSTYASKYDTKTDKLFNVPKVVVCLVDDNFEAVQAAIPPIGKNRVKGEPEKNWCFFSHKNQLQCLYSTRPLTIERETEETLTINTDVLEQVTHGAPTFNSLPPINIGYGHLIFYHWKNMAIEPNGKGYLLYQLGAYIVDRDFKEVLYVDKNPLFIGSRNDNVITWTDYAGNPVSEQPAVILPFGAYVEGTELVMSLGVNDAFMGIFRTPLENIVKRMEKVS
jgi:predicted GH43/DUF377 family glycosyl hydrolase